MAPQYLSEKLKLKNKHGLRSDNKNQLSIPKSRLKSYGDRLFSVAGPRLWNTLPDNLRLCTNLVTFIRELKTHLFKVASNL